MNHNAISSKPCLFSTTTIIFCMVFSEFSKDTQGSFLILSHLAAITMQGSIAYTFKIHMHANCDSINTQ